MDGPCQQRQFAMRHQVVDVAQVRAFIRPFQYRRGQTMGQSQPEITGQHQRQRQNY
jgi:hypothetical protein